MTDTRKHAARTGTVKTDDQVSIAYRAFGDGPKTVLLQPGWTHSGALWNWMIDAMDLGGVCVVAPDPRGTGASDKPSDGYSVERMAKDTLAVADAVGAKQFVMVGHSMGGKISQYLCAHHADRVSGQVLLGPAPPMPMQLPPEFLGLMRAIPGNRTALWMLFGAALVGIPTGEMREAVFQDMEKCNVKALSAQLEEILLKGEFAGALAKTTAPTLIVTTDCPIFTRQALCSMLPLFPKAYATHLPGVGHWPMLENPAAIAGILKAFVAGR